MWMGENKVATSDVEKAINLFDIRFTPGIL